MRNPASSPEGAGKGSASTGGDGVRDCPLVAESFLLFVPVESVLLMFAEGAGSDVGDDPLLLLFSEHNHPLGLVDEAF